MSFDDLFKTLVVDTWYKTFAVAGSALFVLSLSIDVKGMSNGQLQLLAGGLFLLGIGVWKNVKVASWIKPPNAYTGPAALVRAQFRQPDAVGLTFEVIGIFLMLLFVISLMFGRAATPSQQPASPVKQPPSASSV